ncbi:hypothetical protein [Mesorhizobium sp. 2RAF21]|uniref:hypothetical protein n=1 Tax=Mesorhizobium sp. 2RAF21 TaxID=3232995 RepID=UPI003F9CE0F7
MMKIAASSMTIRRRGTGADGDVIARLTAVTKNVRLDCECRSRLDEALDRFAALERRRAKLGNLSNACGQRRKIEAILLFLQDLDDLKATEADHSVYNDIAFLFEDIATAALEGAWAMRQLCSPNDA